MRLLCNKKHCCTCTYSSLFNRCHGDHLDCAIQLISATFDLVMVLLRCGRIRVVVMIVAVTGMVVGNSQVAGNSSLW